MMNSGHESKPRPLPGVVLGLAGALAVTGVVAFAAIKPAGACNPILKRQAFLYKSDDYSK